MCIFPPDIEDASISASRWPRAGRAVRDLSFRRILRQWFLQQHRGKQFLFPMSRKRFNRYGGFDERFTSPWRPRQLGDISSLRDPPRRAKGDLAGSARGRFIRSMTPLALLRGKTKWMCFPANTRPFSAVLMPVQSTTRSTRESRAPRWFHSFRNRSNADVGGRGEV